MFIVLPRLLNKERESLKCALFFFTFISWILFYQLFIYSTIEKIYKVMKKDYRKILS